LRYPGGKASLYPKLRELIRLNRLSRGTYVEPFAGGAGAGLALLITGQVQKIVINDLDPAIHAFWKAVVSDPAEFTLRIQSATLTVDEWERQKAVYAECDVSNPMELGFATFYLNRTNRSGVLNGGPIGGKDQSGTYGIDARFMKDTLIERVRLISLHTSRIEVCNQNGADVIRELAEDPEVFIYADPPYFDKAGSLYLNAFTPDDHRFLADMLNSLATSTWVLTYDNVPQVSELYAERRQELIALHYSAHRSAKVNEIMVYSDDVLVSK
jgi:DNA adenine methylase